MNGMRCCFIKIVIEGYIVALCTLLLLFRFFLQVILDTLALAHLYGFVDLEAAISDYLREILNIKNVCSTLDTALLYHLKFLTKVSILYFYS